MSSQVLVGSCIILGLLGTWNTWTLYQVNKRLDAIEQMDSSPNSLKVSSKKVTGNTNSPSYEQNTIKAKNLSGMIDNTLSRDKMAVSGQGSTQSTIDLSDPDIQEAIARIAEQNAKTKEEQRRQSKMEAYKTSIKHELEKFASEKEYDSDTVQSIETILDDSTAEWRAVREQVREGEISWIDARTEFKAIGEETETKVTEFISEEDYKELRSRLWGDWGQ